MRKAIVATALCLIAAGRGHAQAVERAWTICEPSAFRACGSVQVTATPNEGGTTDITVTLRNLQGSIPESGSRWSVLYHVLLARNSAAYPGPIVGWIPVAPTWNAGEVGGWAGSQSWAQANGPELVVVRTYFHSRTGIGGCLPGEYALQTCDPLGYTGGVAFHFTSPFAIDLSTFESVQATWYTSEGVDGQSYPSCGIDVPAASGYNGPACDVIPDTETVPEPTSLLLLATGIAGVGLERRRRKGGRDAAGR